MVVTRVGAMGRYRSNGIKLQLCRVNKPRDVMYSMMASVNNTVWNTKNLLREKISGAFIVTKKWYLCEEKILISWTVIIISLCVSNHHVVHLEYIKVLFKKKLNKNSGLGHRGKQQDTAPHRNEKIQTEHKQRT